MKEVRDIDTMPETRQMCFGGMHRGYKRGDMEERDVRDHVVSLSAEVLDENDIDLSKPMGVYVPEWYMRKTALGQRPATASAYHSEDSPAYAIIVNGWTAQRLTDEQVKAIILHEVCHLRAMDIGGRAATAEDADTFQSLLEKYDAPTDFGRGEVVPDRTEFYADAEWY